MKKKILTIVLCLVMLTVLTSTFTVNSNAANAYTIIVNGGVAKVGGVTVTKAEVGTTVTLVANEAPAGQEFERWQVTSNAATVTDPNSPTTTFIMPATNVIITANYQVKGITTLDHVEMSSSLPGELYIGDTLPTPTAIQFTTFDNSQPAMMYPSLAGHNARWTKYDGTQKTYVPVSQGANVAEGGKYRYEVYLGMSSLNAAYYQKTYGDNLSLTVDGKAWTPDANEHLGKGSTVPYVLVYSPVYEAKVKTDNRTPITKIEATSNVDTIPYYGEYADYARFEITTGSPAVSELARSGWLKDGVGQLLLPPYRFEAGNYCYYATFVLESGAEKTHRFTENTVVIIDGVSWTVETLRDNGGALSVNSPEYKITQDTVMPIHTVTETVSGIVAGAKATAGVINKTDKYTLSIGWSTTADGSVANDFNDKTFAAGKTYYADFYFVAEGAKVFAKDTTVVINGKSYTAVWTIGADYKKYIAVYDVPFAIPNATYLVSFAPGGGTGTMAGVTVEKGDYTLPQNGFTAPSGKRFKAWSVGGKEVSPNGKITVTANTTVTALWEPIPADHVCKQEPVSKVDPTCTENGKEAYFRCEGCGRFYEDAAGTKEITDLFSWGNLEKLGHADADRDNKCDACGFVLSLPSDTIPLPVPPSTATDDADNSDTTDTPTASKTASEPSKTKNEKEPSLGWIWIIAAVLFVAAGTTVTILMLRKKKAKEQI